MVHVYDGEACVSEGLFCDETPAPLQNLQFFTCNIVLYEKPLMSLCAPWANHISSSKVLPLQLDSKHLFVRTELKSLPTSDVSGKKLKASLLTASSRARLVGYSAVVT